MATAVSSKRLDVLLVNAPREATATRRTSSDDRRPPLGLMYISARLKSEGVRTRLIDAEALSIGLHGVLAAAVESQPRLLGLNCHTLNRHVVYEIASAVRVVLPETRIVLGGAHPALAPEATLRECRIVDGIAEGEGEELMVALADGGMPLQEVPGIYFRDGDHISSSGRRERILNLDALPYPDVEDIPIEDYLAYADPSLPGLWKRGYLSASRGCRFRCSYCTEHSFWAGGNTFRSAESIAAEVDWYRQRFSVNRFYFYDDTLTDWPELTRFCEMAASTGTLWSGSTRIEHMTPTAIETLAAGGCREMAFGLESGSPRTQSFVRKSWLASCPREQAAFIVRTCLDHEIVPRAHFMIGFPWEERSDITQTVELAVWLREHSLGDANFFVVKRYPGTFASGKGMSADMDNVPASSLYNVQSVVDWYTTRNKKVAAKLRRFNDIPEVSLNPHLETLALRQLVRNAYELFFSDCSVLSVERLLWEGVRWDD